MRGLEQIPLLYDALCTLLELRGLGRWREWLVKGARGRTLEVGCGTGRNLSRYTTSTTIAVEPDALMLKRARSRGTQALLVQASAEALPFRDQAFETVISSLVFCSVPDVAKGLSEVKRVLAAGGALRMLEHVRSTSKTWSRVQDLMQPLYTCVAGGCHNNRETEIAVEAAGFVISSDGRRASGTLRRFVARVSTAAR